MNGGKEARDGGRRREEGREERVGLLSEEAWNSANLTASLSQT